MNAYEILSKYYDSFTQDVDYSRYADFCVRRFEAAGVNPKLVLELACGTGSLTKELSLRGYEMIGTDVSREMLSQAYSKCSDLPQPPLFLNQSFDKLNLYGTVQAAVCCLDSFNYVTDPAVLKKALMRVSLFCEPGSPFIFDVNSKHKFVSIDGTAYTRECDEAFCVYAADYDCKTSLLEYSVDVFVRCGALYKRFSETHMQRYYSLDELSALLTCAGFRDIQFFGDFSGTAPDEHDMRVYITCKKG